MSLKQDFVQQLKAQTEIWQSQIKEYQEQMAQAGDKARADYAKTISLLESKTNEARQTFERVQSANEAAWQDVQKANQKAFAELQKGWADALSHFK